MVPLRSGRSLCSSAEVNSSLPAQGVRCVCGDLSWVGLGGEFESQADGVKAQPERHRCGVRDGVRWVIAGQADGVKAQPDLRNPHLVWLTG